MLKELGSVTLRRASPATWQRLKYRQYLQSGELEIRQVENFIDPTRYAIDVGVYMGFYTRHFAKFAKGVIGFEANPHSAEFASKALRGIARIEWAALSSRPGIAVLRVPKGRTGGEAALGTIAASNSLSGRETRVFNVPQKRMDDCDLPPVGFVKIDVEGHEEDVLDGGVALLERDRPTYLIEIEDRYNGGALARIVSRFADHNYSGSYWDGSRFQPISAFHPEFHQSRTSNPYINNFFFVPQ